MDADSYQDKGWAWVIVGAALLLNFFMVGVAKSLGLFFIEFLDTFQLSSSATSIIFGCQGVAFSMGSVCMMSVLMEKFSCRVFVMFGGLTCGLGISLTAYMQNLTGAVLTMGFLNGFGQSLIYGPTMVILGQYFKRRHAMACGIAVAGGSVGQFLIPPLMRFTMDRFGFRGALLIIGGMIFNCVVCGALMRPVPKTKPHVPEDRDETSQEHSYTQKTPMSTTQRINKFSSTEIQTQIENGSTQYVIRHDQDHRSNTLVSPSVGDSIEDQNSQTFYPQLRVNSEDSIHLLTGCSEVPCKMDTQYFQVSSGENEISLQQSKSIERFSSSTNGNTFMRFLRRGNVLAKFNSCVCFVKNPENSSPKIHSRRKTCPNRIIDFSLLSNPLYLLELWCFVLAYIGVTAQLIFFPPYAEDVGLHRGQITLLVSITGVCDLVGRILIGLLADTNLVERYKILAVALILQGLSAILTYLAISFWSLVAISVAYGTFGGVLASLLPVILTDFHGIVTLPKAMGLVFLFQGIFFCGFNILFGWMKDSTGSYIPSFHLIGSFELVSGLSFFFVPLLSKWKFTQDLSVEVTPEKSRNQI